jgi:DNA-binding MarR family transcriptional regulator
MSDKKENECLGYLKALSDETRWQIVRLLTTSPEAWSLGDIAKRLGISDYNASRHVRILSEASLVEIVRDGRFKRIAITPQIRARIQSQAGPGMLDLGCCRFDFSSQRSDDSA